MKIHSLAIPALCLALAAGCTRLDTPASVPATAPTPAPAYAAPVPAGVTVPESAPPKPAATYSSFDLGDTKKTIPAGMIKFQEMDLRQLLDFYQELSGRTLIRSPQVPMTAKITVENATAMTRTEALQMLDNVLAAQQIVMVYLGTSYVKVVTAREAPSEAGPVFDGPWRQLPDSSSFVIYVTKLKTVSAEDAVPVLENYFEGLTKPPYLLLKYFSYEDAVSLITPFAKLPNSIMAVKGSGVLVLRDYSSNVRKMMDMLERLEASQAEAKKK
jgi:general secretion pathway protein D